MITFCTGNTSTLTDIFILYVTSEGYPALFHSDIVASRQDMPGF